jgi:hypothetical protein
MEGKDFQANYILVIATSGRCGRKLDLSLWYFAACREADNQSCTARAWKI